MSDKKRTKKVVNIPEVLHVAKALRHRRVQVGYGLREAAKKSGLSLGYISMIELGYNIPTLPTLMKLCGALDITMVQLFALAAAQDRINQIADEAMTHIPDAIP